MRTIDRTVRFKKDYKRESKGRFRLTLDQELWEALQYLLVDTPLPRRFDDHSLTGKWGDHRDCHIKPDLVLIYSKPNPYTLLLARLGSHSEVF